MDSYYSQWACFFGQGYGRFDDLDYITMFADYRVPQVLVHFGTMSYDNHLMKLLKEGEEFRTYCCHRYLFRIDLFFHQDKILEVGSPEEVEIRGASIFVVEELKKAVFEELTSKYPGVSTENLNSILLDHFLWDYRRDHAKELEYIPFHKTIGIYY